MINNSQLDDVINSVTRRLKVYINIFSTGCYRTSNALEVALSSKRLVTSAVDYFVFSGKIGIFTKYQATTKSYKDLPSTRQTQLRLGEKSIACETLRIEI